MARQLPSSVVRGLVDTDPADLDDRQATSEPLLLHRRREGPCENEQDRCRDSRGRAEPSSNAMCSSPTVPVSFPWAAPGALIASSFRQVELVELSVELKGANQEQP